MAIEQCADDSAGITVVELPSGTMQWKVKPSDASIQVVGETILAPGPTGLRVSPGPGLTRAPDGKPSWIMEAAAILRSGAGQHTGVTTGNGQLVLQNLVGSVTNNTPAQRFLSGMWQIPWIDVLDVNNSAPTIIGYFGIGIGGAAIGESELFHMHTDFPGNTSRRVRMPGNCYQEIYVVNPGVTWTFSLRTLCAANNGGGNFTAFIPGSRIDLFWMGGPTPAS